MSIDINEEIGNPEATWEDFQVINDAAERAVVALAPTGRDSMAFRSFCLFNIGDITDLSVSGVRASLLVSLDQHLPVENRLNAPEAAAFVAIVSAMDRKSDNFVSDMLVVSRGFLAA